MTEKGKQIKTIKQAREAINELNTLLAEGKIYAENYRCLYRGYKTIIHTLLEEERQKKEKKRRTTGKKTPASGRTRVTPHTAISGKTQMCKDASGASKETRKAVYPEFERDEVKDDLKSYLQGDLSGEELEAKYSKQFGGG